MHGKIERPDHKDLDQGIIVHGGIGSQMGGPKRSDCQHEQSETRALGEQFTSNFIDAPQAEGQQEHTQHP